MTARLEKNEKSVKSDKNNEIAVEVVEVEDGVFNISFSDRAFRVFEEGAAAAGVTMEEFINSVLREYLDRLEDAAC